MLKKLVIIFILIHSIDSFAGVGGSHGGNDKDKGPKDRSSFR